MIGNFGDMMNLMGKVQELQNKVKEAQAELNTLTETGESGAGLVKVTVNGKKTMVDIEIDPILMKPEDREMLQDLIVAAVNAANEKIEPKIKDHLQKATAGVIPNIPGLDLGNLMGG